MADNFLALLDANKAQVESLLPKYLTPERFFTLARLVDRDPNLKKCTPQSLFDCVMKAAQTGLEIGTADQHAYIIPYGNEAQFQPSYKGLIFRLVQAGVVSHMYADVVRKNDFYEMISGTERKFVHKPLIFGDRGDVIGAYCVATLPNGIVDFEVMEQRDLEAIQKAARRIAGGKDSPAWAAFPDEMRKKSVIKRHAKRLQGERRGLIKNDEGDRLDLAFEEIKRETGEIVVDDMPTAMDGTPAPTPRSVKVEVVSPPKNDRALTTQEQDDLFEGWVAAGGKRSALEPFLKKNFEVDDLAALRLSQLQPCIDAIGAEFQS